MILRHCNYLFRSGNCYYFGKLWPGENVPCEKLNRKFIYHWKMLDTKQLILFNRRFLA